jgi:hypothetical protein
MAQEILHHNLMAVGTPVGMSPGVIGDALQRR